VTDHSSLPRRTARRPAIAICVVAALAIAMPMGGASAGRSDRPASRPDDGAIAPVAIAAGSVQHDGRSVRGVSGIAPSTVASPAAAAAFDPAAVNLHLALLKSGLSNPVLLTNAGDGSGRRFVVEQTGKVRIITAGGTLLAAPFIDLTGLISTGGERGLLGLAFHPHFETNGFFFLDYTNTAGDTIINRYHAQPGANAVSRATARRIMTIDQPYANHNGGNLAFGPDGYLYIGMGDGGSAGDPGNRAQNLSSLLGKMLRIDINHTSTGKNYRAPSTNPYVGRSGRDEIWSRGLRNPWRWSFDVPTRRLFIGDVGQGRYEEVDRSNPVGTRPAGWASNYGWRQLEGYACYNPSTGCAKTGKVPPLLAYSHVVGGTDNCAITGGYVYRGTANPVLAGGYLYGDYCSGRIWVVDPSAAKPATGTLVHDAGVAPTMLISSFGQDEAGELYVCDLTGSIYQISAT
jgi:glucose/arabinose dehydrogenase